MKTAITHPGQAHRDEFMALCLLIAAGKVSKIERRNPTGAELDSPDVYCIDVGLRHEPELLNFDHHQFARDAAPTCSITLVLEHLKIDPILARQIWGWLAFSESLDSKGPFATASALGMTSDTLFATVSPIETSVLRWFEGEDTVFQDETFSSVGGDTLAEGRLWHLMRMIGKEKLEYLNEVQSRLTRLASETSQVTIQGLNVLDATSIPRTENPTLALEIFCRGLAHAPAVTVTCDDRGEGLCLFRRNDHPRVDFSQLEGEVLFAHKAGFVAKTYPGQDWINLVAKSVNS